MLAASWPLWIEGGDIPRVPFASGFPVLPPVVAGFTFLAAIGSATMTGISRSWRPWLAVWLGLTVVMVLGDQHRFQAWTYQSAAILTLLATLPGGRGLNFARWWFVSIYVHSGLSKLDRSFMDELGPVFLDSGPRAFGLTLAPIPAAVRDVLVLALPLGEILVGVSLLFEPSRSISRYSAVFLHGLLILILGPLGLRHSTLVLVWNATMAVEVWVAFGPRVGVQAVTRREVARSLPIVLAFGVLVTLPFIERSEYFDAWPSHALYASHVGRMSLRLHESERDAWPAGLDRFIRRVDGDEGYVSLDLNAWSLALRGTPVYPRNRACLGLAEGLAARYGGQLTRVVLFGPADPLDGTRSREEVTGLAAIRRRGDRFLLNAHPAASRR